MDTILVTGGFGYIGSHTCVSLLEKVYFVLVVDSLINSFKDNFKKIRQILLEKGINPNNRFEFIEGDIRNRLLLDDIFNEYAKAKKPIKSVLHFAGLKSISTSIKKPLEYWETNILSTLTLISVMKKYHCFTLIFSSSATVYKTNNFQVLRESNRVQPSNPYGKTKFCIEEILKDIYNSENNWRIANLRYFNPVGAHDSGLLFEKPKGKSSNLFPAIINTTRGRQKKLLIFGKDWPTPDGTCIRDFIHIMDLAEAHIATLDFVRNYQKKYISINVGTGKGTSILEVIQTFQKINGKDFIYEFAKSRLGDLPFVVADNQLALQLLDWKPKRDLFDMCNDSLNIK